MTFKVRKNTDLIHAMKYSALLGLVVALFFFRVHGTLTLHIYDDPPEFIRRCVNEISTISLNDDGSCNALGSLFYIIEPTVGNPSIDTLTILSTCSCEMRTVPCGGTVYNNTCELERTTGSFCNSYDDDDGVQTALGGGNAYALETGCTCIAVDGCSSETFDGGRRSEDGMDGDDGVSRGTRKRGAASFAPGSTCFGNIL